jgi:hypothetical protein
MTLIPDCLVPSDDGQTVGTHNLESAPQEDMLLVLFNTAISNLVRKTRYCVTVAT